MTIEVGIIISILGLIVAFQTYQLNKQKHQTTQHKDANEVVKKDATDQAELRTELRYISTGVDNIRIDLKANEKQIGALSERVTRVEESAKQAHKRIDNISPE